MYIYWRTAGDLRYVMGCSHHVHTDDACCMELIDHPFRWHSHCTSKEFDFLFNQYVTELGELAIRVILISSTGALANFWDQKVNPEREIAFKFLTYESNLFSEHFGIVGKSSDRAQASRVGDGGADPMGRNLLVRLDKKRGASSVLKSSD